MKRFILSIALLIAIIGGGKLIMHLTYPETVAEPVSVENDNVNETITDSLTITDSIQ